VWGFAAPVVGESGLLAWYGLRQCRLAFGTATGLARGPGTGLMVYASPVVAVPVLWALVGGSAALVLGVATDYSLLACSVLLVVGTVPGGSNSNLMNVLAPAKGAAWLRWSGTRRA